MFTDVQDALRQIVADTAAPRVAPTGKLVRALQQFPYAAELHFLYGSEMAEAGKVEEAITSLGQALILKPELHIARFQLAFFQLVNGNVAAVKVLLQPLLLDEDKANYLTFFARGCIAATLDNIDECKQLIEQGIALNTVNEALNANMKKMLMLLSADETTQPNDNISDDGFGSVLFDIYTQQKH